METKSEEKPPRDEFRLYVPREVIIATKAVDEKDKRFWWGPLTLIMEGGGGHWLAETVNELIQDSRQGIYCLQLEGGEGLKVGDDIDLYGDDWVRVGDVPRPWKWSLPKLGRDESDLKFLRTLCPERYSKLLWIRVRKGMMEEYEAQDEMREIFGRDLFPPPDQGGAA